MSAGARDSNNPRRWGRRELNPRLYHSKVTLYVKLLPRTADDVNKLRYTAHLF